MIYQQTPDFYNEYISHSAVWEGRSRYRNGEDELEHGWVKDAAAKAHKYIDRWRNKAGKWVYQYKNEIRDKRVANKRKEAGLTAPEWVSFNIMGKKLGAGPKGGIIAARSDDGRVKSYSHYSRIAARARSTDQPKNAIQAGRKRAAKKGYKVKGYTGNLTSRGYSGSKGSGESQRQRNLGTRYSSRSLINTTKDVGKIGNATYTLDRAERAKIYNEWRKNPQRTIAKDAILNKRTLGESDKYSANKGYKRGKKKKR